MSTQNGCSPATLLIEKESRNTWANFIQNMAVTASDGPSPHSPSLRLDLPAPRHHAQSCCAPHFMTQELIMFSNPTPSKPHLSPTAAMSNDTLSALTLPLHFLSCSLRPLLKLSLLSLNPSLLQFVSIVYFCWITEIRSLNLLVRFYLFPFRICLCFSDRNELQL